MSIKRPIALLSLSMLVLSSCSTSKQWIEDDVYTSKQALLPTDTDISDEADYNAFAYRKSKNDRREVIYTSDFNDANRINGRRFGTSVVYGVMFPANCYRPYYGMNSYYYTTSSFGYQPYSMIGGCGCGYNAFYGAYGSYNNFGGLISPFMSGMSYVGNSNNSYLNSVYGGPISGYNYQTGKFSGPRGSYSGMGGVSSRSDVSIKSSTTPVLNSGKKPTPIATRPISRTETLGRGTNVSNGNALSNRPATDLNKGNSLANRPVARPAQPNRGTSPSGGTSTVSRSEGTSGRTTTGTTISRGSSTRNDTSPRPSASGGSISRSGASGSGGSVSGSGGGTKTVGRR